MSCFFAFFNFFFSRENSYKQKICCLNSVLIAVALATAFSISATTPLKAEKVKYGPTQELAGPGGKDYFHGSFTTWEAGDFPHERYLVFEPADPTPQKAGMVLYVHDLMYPAPQNYLGHIRHLCRKGWIVIFPFYEGTGQAMDQYLFNIVRSVKDYLIKSFNKNKIESDHNKFAIIGHGSGAVLAANTAAVYDYFGLPLPKVLLVNMPDRAYTKMLDLSGISRETRLGVISGDRVIENDAVAAREIFYNADRVKTVNKIFVTVQTDLYGQPPLIGDKRSGLSIENPKYERAIVDKRNDFITTYKSSFAAQYLRAHDIENYDWKISYRIFDMLAIAAFNLNSDLKPMKKSEELQSMGYWSDGKKVKRLIITDRP